MTVVAVAMATDETEAAPPELAFAFAELETAARKEEASFSVLNLVLVSTRLRGRV